MYVRPSEGYLVHARPSPRSTSRIRRNLVYV
jgi:hypothetical protein